MPKIPPMTPEACKAYDVAKRRIAACKLRENPFKELDLSDLGLTVLPPEIGQLSTIPSLDLRDNLLTTLPPEIGKLSGLIRLDLRGNKLTTLPLEIGQLLALADLSLSNNQLTALPPEIGKLKRLSRLLLEDNALSGLPESLKQITNLRELTLHGNEDLELPAEVLGPRYRASGSWGEYAANPQGILEWYFRNRASAVKSPILEAKVILVGWGKVGKTSLRKRLVDKTFNAEEPQTHKIEITSWPVTVGRDQVQLHMWDFGGQEIMHATHQFFLTKRSLYVLVLAGREKTQGAQEAEYWLRLIGSYGGGSPVLVVLNQQHSCPFDLNRQSLKEKYPFIRGFVQTDCAPPLRLDELERMILAEVDRLPELRTEFDAKWLAVKDAVSDLKRKGGKRMSVQAFQGLCESKGETEDRWQKWLLGFLHDLGTVVCFHDDLRLANDGVLDPQWVVDGIYTLLTEKSLQGGDGQVTRKQIRALLPIADYTDDDVRVLVELMEKFELCFSLPGSRHTLVVPELMTEQEVDWKPLFPALEKFLRFELKYDFLPEGLVPRFIVATHDLSQSGGRWRSGVVLRQGNNTALVRGDAVAGRVSIAVSGPEPTRRDLLAIIRRDFAKIHQSITGLVVKERVPVPGLDVEPIEYEHLLAAEAASEKKWTVVSNNVLHKVPISRLLDGIEPREKRIARIKEKAGRGGRIIQVQGDYIEGLKTLNTDSHNITIGGDVTNAQVGQTLTQCTNMIQQQAPGEVKALLTKLEREVQQLLSKLPTDKHEEVAGNLELMVKAATSAKPNRAWYSVSADGLLEASKWVSDFTGNITGTVGKLGKLLGF